ncbi:MAG: ABC transporter permease [Ilumatobacter sp.]|uniref:ABC transporter permease n=1 Tax=Ilumatobacter sp. TaxID=1967498 RepID=UPI002629AD89|nr:ABC transporter permease [Ilumatobacter sp.]MDJ0768358.1 ABC transporter permease [Ilumatobacter sp.]
MTEVQRPTSVFAPYRAGLPPIRPYASALWTRRRFAFEMARSGRRARHVDSLFGQVWNLLNPLLLALVYWFLITIIRGSSGGIDGIVALISGLFAFFYSREVMASGAGSVVGGGGLLLNSAFPRLLLPLSALFNAMMSHRAQLIVLAVLVVAVGFPIGPHLLWLVPILVIQTAISTGLMLLLAVLTVYFRDTSSLLSYVLRIWLYLSPVLYRPSEVPSGARPWTHLNPLFDIIGAWQRVVVDGLAPQATDLLVSVGWSVVVLTTGVVLFLSKEREFAVRI